MSMEEDKQVAIEVLKVLRDDYTRRINFVAEAVRITPESYARVAHLIEVKRIKTKYDPTIKEENPRSYGRYTALNSAKDANTLRMATLPIVDKIALHECTHAAIDAKRLPRRRGLSHAEDEGICFIAQALYCNYSCQRFTDWAHVDALKTAVGITATRIAQKIVASGARQYVVSKEDMRELRISIGRMPGSYHHSQNIPATSDGVHRGSRSECVYHGD